MNSFYQWQITVRSEDSSRELQGEPGETQPTESTGGAGACADSRQVTWSTVSTVNRDFFLRVMNFHLCVCLLNNPLLIFVSL